MITITVDNVKREINEGTTLLEALVRFTPYGEESTICNLNGATYKSIDSEISGIELHDGDTLNIYPLVIGG